MSNNGRPKMSNGDVIATMMEQHWNAHPRWNGVARPYKPEDVLRLRGSVLVEHTLARMGAERMWKLLHSEPYVHSLGAVTGHQAIQQVQAGLQAIYCSGWQVAGVAHQRDLVDVDRQNGGKLHRDCRSTISWRVRSVATPQW